VRRLSMLVSFVTLIVSAVPSAYAAPAGTTRQRVLFQSTFRTTGLKGWIRTNRALWHVTRGGIVTFDGSTTGLILAPFSIAGVHDFAVQASLQAVGNADNPVSGYGVLVRGGPNPSGISAGSFSSQDNSFFSGPLFVWGTDSIGGSAVPLHSGFNTYRVEVHGTDYTLAIDGKKAVQFTIADFSSGTRVGIWSLNQKLQVKSFKVTRLAKATPLPALPPVKAVNLTAPDVASPLQVAFDHYYSNAELARAAGVPVVDLDDAGLLVTHEAAFAPAQPPQSGPYAVSSYVYGYSSTPAAATGLGNDWPDFQKRWAASLRFSAGDLTGLGDEAHQLSFDYTETGFGGSGFPATLVGIFFQRGAYEVTLFEDFVAGSRADMIAAATALAKVVDGRIQHVTPAK
jgi:hypothetical protein